MIHIFKIKVIDSEDNEEETMFLVCKWNHGPGMAVIALCYSESEALQIKKENE